MIAHWLSGVFLDTGVEESPITDQCDVEQEHPRVPNFQKAIALVANRWRQIITTLTMGWLTEITNNNTSQRSLFTISYTVVYLGNN